MSQDIVNSFASNIAGSNPTGSKGNRPRLGRHLVRVGACKFAKKAEPPHDAFAALEFQVVQTLFSDTRGGNLTEDEKRTPGIDPNGTVDPHLPGEVISAVWVNSGKAAMMFNGNIKGFIIAAQASTANFLDAHKKLGADVSEFEEFYKGLGLNLTKDKSSEVTPEAVNATFGTEQVFAGREMVMVVGRVKTKAGNYIDAATFQPLSVDEHVKREQEQ